MCYAVLDTLSLWPNRYRGSEGAPGRTCEVVCPRATMITASSTTFTMTSGRTSYTTSSPRYLRLYYGICEMRRHFHNILYDTRSVICNSQIAICVQGVVPTLCYSCSCISCCRTAWRTTKWIAAFSSARDFAQDAALPHRGSD